MDVSEWLVTVLGSILTALVIYALKTHKNNANLKSEAKGLQCKVDELIAEATSIKEKLDSVAKEKERLEKENTELKASVTQITLSVKEDINSVAKEKERLEAEIARLLEENGEHAKQAANYAIFHEYVEESGVLFRKISDEHTECVFCPTCKLALHGNTKMSCSKCGFVAPFYKKHLAGIVRHLVTSNKISRTDEQLNNLPKPPEHRIQTISRKTRDQEAIDKYFLGPMRFW